MQLVKSGVAKPALRVDGIYSLLLVAKIAAVDVGSGGSPLSSIFSFDKESCIT